MINKQIKNSIELKLDSILENGKYQHKQSLLTIDSVKSEIHEINEQVTKSIESQKSKLEELNKKYISPVRSVFWDFIYPILLSMISAVIFWILFSFCPERARKSKIRIKLDLEIYQVYTNIFALFDIVFKMNNHSPSDYQHQIRGEKLSRRDIEIGLQNKCLNESYFYYPELQQALLPIGKSLYNYIQKIDRIIDRLFNFSMYLLPEEILLLEDIRNKLYTYDLENYERNAISVIGGISFKPINPSLSYMTNNFAELYELYKQLQKIVFKNKFENRNIFVSKVQYLFYSEQYEATIKSVKKNMHKYANDEDFLNWYIFQSLYSLKKQPEAYKLLENLFEKKAHLLSNRNSIKKFLFDSKIQELLNKYYSSKNLIELNNIINEEELIANTFINNAKLLEELYTEKKTENEKK